MSIDDKDRDRSGSSGKSTTKFKERPSDQNRKPHPENVQGGESPMMDDPAIEQQEGQDIGHASEEVREKVRRSIPKPGQTGKKPASGGEQSAQQKEGKKDDNDDAGCSDCGS